MQRLRHLAQAPPQLMRRCRAWQACCCWRRCCWHYYCCLKTPHLLLLLLSLLLVCDALVAALQVGWLRAAAEAAARAAAAAGAAGASSAPVAPKAPLQVGETIQGSGHGRQRLWAPRDGSSCQHPSRLTCGWQHRILPLSSCEADGTPGSTACGRVRAVLVPAAGLDRHGFELRFAIQLQFCKR